MANTDNYQEIKDNLAKMSVDELVEQFNALVGKNAWTSARATHDTAIVDILIRKGVDVSAVYDGTSISFQSKITLNEDKTKVLVSK